MWEVPLPALLGEGTANSAYIFAFYGRACGRGRIVLSVDKVNRASGKNFGHDNTPPPNSLSLKLRKKSKM